MGARTTREVVSDAADGEDPQKPIYAHWRLLNRLVPNFSLTQNSCGSSLQPAFLPVVTPLSQREEREDFVHCRSCRPT